METRSRGIVRRVERADWPIVEAMFAHSFRDCRPPQVWDWRYRRSASPEVAWRAWLVQSPQGEVLGFFGGTLHPCIVHGAPAIAVIGRDAFTVPRALHGLGASGSPFLRAEAAFHGDCAAVAAFCTGFGLQRRARIGEVRNTSVTIREGRWFTRSVEVSADHWGSTCRAESTSFAETEWDDFWLMRKASLQSALVRDRAFLAWRFDERQGHAYWCFALRSSASDLPLGYLCVRDMGGGSAFIVDAALPREIQRSRDGLFQVLQWLNAIGIRQVRTYASCATPEFEAWPALGFEASVSAPMDTVPLFRAYGLAITPGEFSRTFAMTLADSDFC